MAWSNWKTENIGIKVAGAPAVSSWKEGRLEVIVRSTDNRLYYRAYENDIWQGANWKEITDGRNVEVSLGAASWGPLRVDLFAVSNKEVYHRLWQNLTWNPWAEYLDGVTNDAPAAASWKVERVDVLVHTTDNFMSRRYWEAGKTFETGQAWKNWENIGGQSKNLMSAPAAAATGPNQIDCFGRGSTGHLIHTWYQDDRQVAWEEIDTLAIKDAPAAVSGRTADRGRVDVFVRGPDDLLKHRIYYARLQAGQPAGDTIHTAVAGDDLLKIAGQYNVSQESLKALNPQLRPPDYVVHVADRILIAHHEAVPPLSGWAPGGSWEDLSTNKIASAPSAAVWWSANVLKRIDVFAQDANNNLIHTWWK